MQKIFIKYTFLIVTSAILLIFIINFLYTMHTQETQQFQTFQSKLEQVVHTLETNQTELNLVSQYLDEDYLTRARAAAYVIDQQEEAKKDVAEMQELAELLNVDELHVVDENGIILYASVSSYVGFDMNSHEQTRAFLSLLEPNGQDFLIQEMQPNAAEGKLMQYIGVARKEQKGLVQVGFKPTRLMEARFRNTYDYIFSKFPTDLGEELFAIDTQTGTVVGHSDGINQPFTAPCYQLDKLSESNEGIYQNGKQDKSMYVVSRHYNHLLICAMLPREILFQRLWKHVVSTLFYLLLIEVLVIFLLNYLVKRKAVDGIHKILENLSAITNGSLDTTVAVGGNPEFEKLSQGINSMVKSILHSSDRISTIIEVSGVPLAAFEYQSNTKHLFTTSGLRKLLNISDYTSEEIYQNAGLFEQYIRTITAHPVDGENDIFQVSDTKFIRIHMSNSPHGSLGVITDVSKDILEKQRMHYENTHDNLTNLYKFRTFKQLAADLLHRKTAQELCAVVMLDLDYFKTINDNFGHDAGDQYLQGFSNVLLSMNEDHFLTARRSGDEFCMFLHGCQNKSEILHFLDFFYEALEHTRIPLSKDVSQSIHASAGFSWTKDSAADLSELLSQADQALYDVKRKTKGKYAEYQASERD